MHRIVVLLVLGACGRVGFDLDAPTDAAPACTFGAFSAPVQLAGPVQSAGDDWVPTPTADELGLYFYQFIGATEDGEVVYASRASTADLFSAPAPVTELESDVSEFAVSLTDDGLDLVLTRRIGTAPRLFEAQRASTAEPFGTPVMISSLGESLQDETGWLSADGLRMIYARTTASDGGNANLVETRRASRSDSWAAPVLLDALSSTDNENEPTTSADGLELFFASTRPGGAGRWDIYRSTRVSLDDPFGPPALVAELSSPLDDLGCRLSHDGRTLYFNYNTERGGGANSQIWIATRDCE